MFLFAPKITCPHCLAEIRIRKSLTSCRVCGGEIPPQYVYDYAQHPPFFTQVFGWSQVGKTVFLQALTLMLIKMSNIWPQYSWAALTDFSQCRIREIRQYLAQGQMPGPTPRGVQDVYIMLLKNMERWGSRTLVVRDCAGEIFDSMHVPLAEAPYLLKAPTTFMLIGPEGDPSNAGGRSMDMLLNNYINTLLNHGVDFNRVGRRLVVVLTKGDRIMHLPANLRQYLEDDPLWNAVNTPESVRQMDAHAMSQYVNKMRRISDQLSAWVARDDSGKTFLRIAYAHNITLRFSLISATGDDVGSDGLLLSRLAPRRVLDPYFWALEMQQ